MEGLPISNPYSSQSISGYNSSPPADDGSQTSANQLSWSKHKTKLADPIKTLAEAINTAVNTAFATVDNAANLTTGTLPDARLSANVPLLNAAMNTFTGGDLALSGAGGPALRLIDSDAPANEKRFDIRSNGGTLDILTRTDAGAAGEVLFRASLTGTNVDAIALAADSITANGSEILTPAEVAAATAIDVSGLAGSDGIYIDDAGTAKRASIQSLGVRVVELSTIQTFALGDGNSLQVLTGATDRVWTYPTNASVAIPVGVPIYCAARDTAKITLTAAAGVTLTSSRGSGDGSSIDVLPGGMAVVMKVATNEIIVSGDVGNFAA